MTSGCFNRQDRPVYQGQHEDLYSIAVNSVLGSSGYILGEIKFSPELTVLESDQYDRKLFLYSEGNLISTYSLIISQGSDSEYAYFYPDYNFISSSSDSFTTEEIAELKKNNDWDEEINRDKCIKVNIAGTKDEKGPINVKNIMSLYQKVMAEDADDSTYVSYLTSDQYGRSIYSKFAKMRPEGVGRCIVMIFQPDGTYDENKSYMELTDYYDYQDKLKELKEANGWNEPLE